MCSSSDYCYIQHSRRDNYLTKISMVVRSVYAVNVSVSECVCECVRVWECKFLITMLLNM